jgi:hypothetical protein
MDRGEIHDGDPDPRPGGVLARLGLGKDEHHVVPRGEVSPGQVVMQGLVSIVLMGFVIQFEAQELSVKPRRGCQIGGLDLQAVEARHTMYCSGADNDQPATG